MCAGLLRLMQVATVVAIVGAAEVRAGSTLIIGNYPAPNDGTLSAVASHGVGVSKAVGFTMPGTSYHLDSITLRLMEQVGSTSSLTVELFGGTTTPSGSPLVVFNTPAIPNIASDVAFTPLTSFTLQSNTTYWIDVTGTSDVLNGIVWYASLPGVIPTGIAASAGARFDSTGGGLSALSPSTVLNTYAVNGSLDLGPSVVPEPISLIPAATAAVAGLSVFGWRRRRSRSR